MLDSELRSQPLQVLWDYKGVIGRGDKDMVKERKRGSAFKP